MKLIFFFSFFLISSANAEVLKLTNSGDFSLTKNHFKVSELLADYGRLMGYNYICACYEPIIMDKR